MLRLRTSLNMFVSYGSFPEFDQVANPLLRDFLERLPPGSSATRLEVYAVRRLLDGQPELSVPISYDGSTLVLDGQRIAWFEADGSLWGREALPHAPDEGTLARLHSRIMSKLGGSLNLYDPERTGSVVMLMPAEDFAAHRERHSFPTDKCRQAETDLSHHEQGEQAQPDDPAPACFWELRLDVPWKDLLLHDFDNTQARIEGWEMIEVSSATPFIRHLEAGSPFDFSWDAADYVVRRACEGSAYHKSALRLYLTNSEINRDDLYREHGQAAVLSALSDPPSA